MRTVRDFAIAKAFAMGEGRDLDEQAFVASDAAGSTTYVPAGVYLFGANITLSNLLAFEQGATLKPSAGVTLTLNGDIGAGLWQIFDLSTGGSVVLNGVSEVQARWFGAHPAAKGVTNSAAINNAILCAKASGNANVILGPGIFEIDSTIFYSGDNAGITTIGIIQGSFSQGSAPGITTLKWVGGVAPMIEVASSFHSFHGINLQNNGNATHGIRGIGGRLWIDRVKFAQPTGGSAFSTASIEITNGANYDRISRCEFETGTAVKVGAGLGTTLMIDEFMMDSTVGFGAFIDIRGSLDVLTIRGGTVDFREPMLTFIDMSNIGSYRVATCIVAGNEMDSGEVAAQMFIAKLKNCNACLFDSNLISYFGDPANVLPLITATNSRVTLRNNFGYSLNSPLAGTLDSASFIYPYENNLDLTNTAGIVEPSSQTGNLIPAVISGTDILIQGDRASAMAHSVHLANLTVGGTAYIVDVARLSISANQGFMTAGQVFTIIFWNNTGADIGSLTFDKDRFSLSAPRPAPPLAGKRMSMTFQWDGAVAHEINRQFDANPTWVSKTATGAITLSERRIAADAAAGDIVLTLPRADLVQTGGRFLIKKMTAGNTVTIKSIAGFTIDGAPSYALGAQWAVVELESDGTQWLVI